MKGQVPVTSGIWVMGILLTGKLINKMSLSKVTKQPPPQLLISLFLQLQIKVSTLIFWILQISPFPETKILVEFTFGNIMKDELV